MISAATLPVECPTKAFHIQWAQASATTRMWVFVSHRQTDGRTDGKTDKHTYIHADKQTDKMTD